MITKKNTKNLFYGFLTLHLLIWVFVPTFSNQNLPLDTIEALAWGSNLDWGFQKHPPLSALFVEMFYQIFSNQDWAYYLLSQIFVVTAFYVVWKFCEDFFKNRIYSLISILLLEGIIFYNFTTPEFNVNVCLLTFWSLSIYYCWQSFKNDKIRNWILFGFFSGLGFLSKYLFVYLLAGIEIFFIYQIIKIKKFNFKHFISVVIFFIVISPHLLWLEKNNYVTLTYALNRTGLENSDILNHLIYPFIFLGKQIGILIPFFLMSFFLIKKFKIKVNLKDNKVLFLLSVNLLPIIFIFLTSLIFGVKIRTMWMTPFYLFLGVLIIYVFSSNIDFKKIKKFYISFLVFLIISPAIYLYISTTQTNKRTDYPGKEIAYLVQNKWDNNFSNEISIVIGDEWYGGNLSYNLRSRPKWFKSLDINSYVEKEKIEGGVIYVGSPNILKKICPGVYGTIKPIGICMIGSK